MQGEEQTEESYKQRWIALRATVEAWLEINRQINDYSSMFDYGCVLALMDDLEGAGNVRG